MYTREEGVQQGDVNWLPVNQLYWVMKNNVEIWRFVLFHSAVLKLMNDYDGYSNMSTFISYNCYDIIYLSIVTDPIQNHL